VLDRQVQQGIRHAARTGAGKRRTSSSCPYADKVSHFNLAVRNLSI